jgi:lipoprotein-anchoring transpeptidase ErfK/SrfK
VRRYNTRSRKRSSPWKIPLLLFFIALLAAGGVQYFRGGWPFKAAEPPKEGTTIAVPQPSATPIPIPEVAAVPLPKEENPEIMRESLEKAVPNLENIPEDSMWIRIVKSRHTMYIYNGKDLLRSYPVAVGKNAGDKQRVGDCRTPEGSFEIQQMQDASYWTHDFGDGKGPIEGAYGPWFIRIKTDPWKGIGIHGTHDPSSIGKDVTEGCIRLTNEDLRELKPKISLGMKVVIEP